MRKKVTITITLILVSIFLLACTSEIKTTISESTDNNESKTPDEQVWDMALEIYEGLKNKDKDRIKSVFSENQEISCFPEYFALRTYGSSRQQLFEASIEDVG